jgi:hypothetical protein
MTYLSKEWYNVLNKEVWKDIKGFDGLYQVSNLGRIKSLRYGTNILKPFLTGKGYLTVDLCFKGKRKSVRVHRLVADAFIPNPTNKSQINHINGNKKDNSVKNLEWNTQSENINHAFKIGLNERSEEAGKKKKAVYQIKHGIIINQFNSISEAERITNTPRQNIRKVINGKRYSANGYQWKDA